MGLNVFKDYNCWGTRYKLTHPWVVVADKWRDLKAGWQRATKGYAPRDVWNMCDYFLEVFPAMLRDLAENCHAYPGVAPFDSPEKWENWLREMADKLEWCREDVWEKDNEYEEEYMKQFDDNLWQNWKRDEHGNLVYSHTQSEIDKLYFAREKELSDKAHQQLQDVLSQVSRYFFYLWD